MLDQIYAAYAGLTPHDADMLLIGAVLFAVPQLVAASFWLWLKTILNREQDLDV
jgi:hypothetical protein